jgi:ribosomal-protein-alanine N-acetyltransferase
VDTVFHIGPVGAIASAGIIDIHGAPHRFAAPENLSEPPEVSRLALPCRFVNFLPTLAEQPRRHEAALSLERTYSRSLEEGVAPRDRNWFGRLKGWVGCGKKILVAAGDGAALPARFEQVDAGPTRKEALMSAEPQRADSPLAESKQHLRVHIRWMIRRDMAEVLDIERTSFEFPWFEEDFVRCLRQRNCIGMVAEYGERVVGFMIYELHKSRLHILNFAVAAEFRRRGVGRQMIEKLVGKLSSQRRTRITLEVRETNLAAQLFFKSANFRAVTVLRAYYEDSPEDAYLMQFRHATVDEAATLPVNRIDRLAG